MTDSRPPGLGRRRLGALLAAAWLVAGAAAAVEVNRIVLRVNNRIATLYDYEQRKEERIDAIRRSNLAPERKQELVAQAGEEVLRTLYEEMLLLSKADKLGVEATEAEVADAIERAKSSFGIETEEDFRRALEQSNLTIDKLRDQMRSNLLIQKVVGQEVRPRIEVTDENVRKAYQARSEQFQLPVRLQLRELVVLDTSGRSEEERRQLADDLTARIEAGTLSDEEVATLREQGVTTDWMELGWVQPGDLDPGLEAVAFELQGGETSEPIEARGGLHVVQVLDRKEPEQLSFAEVQEQIRRQLADEVFVEEMDDFMAELEAESYVVSRPPPEAANFRAEGTRKRRDPLAKLGVTEADPTLPQE